jgi:hypothetical protein
MDGSGQTNMPAVSGEPKERSGDEQFVNRLADEYKILQDKIDKIGAFRFTIKGWSITVIIAAHCLLEQRRDRCRPCCCSFVCL